MSRADELRAREAKRKADRAAATAVEDQPSTRAPAPRRAAPQVRTATVRKTVDLPPTRYQALSTWCSETAVQLGTSRITGQQVLNTLVARLLTDETLARKIRADLADDLQNN